MIETLLSYGADAKNSQLTSAIFYPDQPDRMNVVYFAEAARNSATHHVHDVTRGSKAFLYCR